MEEKSGAPIGGLSFGTEEVLVTIGLTRQVNQTTTRGGPLSSCKSPQKSAKSDQKSRILLILAGISSPFYGNPFYDQLA